jgi:hypothetical protein
MTIKTHLQTSLLIANIIMSPFAISADERRDRGSALHNMPWNTLDDRQALDAMVKFAECSSIKMFVYKQERQHLKTFDDLDFDVYTNQKWHELGKSHAQDVIGHWPDGRTPVGIDVHNKDIKAMFVFAPNNRIQEHPIRIVDGRWTAAAGIPESTFTRPIPTPDGKPIQPTGRPID